VALRSVGSGSRLGLGLVLGFIAARTAVTTRPSSA
jgi:hypothetical protein